MSHGEGQGRAADISVAICTRDRPELLARLLDALEAADVLPAEVVVVDQSRDSRTERLVNGRGERLRLVYARDAASGLGAAQNRAFALASCAVVAVTDDDCVPARDWLEALEAGFAGEEIAAVTGMVLPLSSERPDLFPVATRPERVERTFTGEALPWEVGSGNNFAVRDQWLARIGGTDERLGPGSPGRGALDMDLFHRVLRAGGVIRYRPSAIVFHEQTDRAGLLARAHLYGHGMGAMCTLWMRRGDRFGAWVLVRWLLSRARRFLRGIAKRDWLLAHEEAIILTETLRGLAWGLRVERGGSSR